jgi:hypothetical protein
MRTPWFGLRDEDKVSANVLVQGRVRVYACAYVSGSASVISFSSVFALLNEF